VGNESLAFRVPTKIPKIPWPVSYTFTRPEVRACYKMFIRRLLDVTDNVIRRAVSSSARTWSRHDVGRPSVVRVRSYVNTATFFRRGHDNRHHLGFLAR